MSTSVATSPRPQAAPLTLQKLADLVRWEFGEKKQRGYNKLTVEEQRIARVRYLALNSTKPLGRLADVAEEFERGKPFNEAKAREAAAKQLRNALRTLEALNMTESDVVRELQKIQ